MYHLKMIMPQKCNDCNDIFYPLPGEKIDIGCIKCERMACPRCYDMNPEVVKRLKYVCIPCVEDLDKEQGFKSLTEEHFKKVREASNRFLASCGKLGKVCPLGIHLGYAILDCGVECEEASKNLIKKKKRKSSITPARRKMENEDRMI